jgi:hypothetical protein
MAQTATKPNAEAATAVKQTAEGTAAVKQTAKAVEQHSKKVADSAKELKHSSPPIPDVARIPHGVLITVNAFLAVVSVAALVGIWAVPS